MIQAILLAVITVCLGLWYRSRRNQLDFFRKLEIPGPEPSVFFGNLLQLYLKGPLICKREWINKYGKVLGYYHGLDPVLLVADVEVMKEVLVKEFDAFTDRPFRMLDLSSDKERSTLSLLNQKGQHWKQTRNLLTPSFTTGKLKNMSPLINDALGEFLVKMEQYSKSGEGFEIYALYKALTMDVIGRTAFGIEANVQDDPDHPLLQVSRAIFKGSVNSLFLVFAFSFRELGMLFLKLISLRRMSRNKVANPMEELGQICKNVIQLRRGDPKLRRPDLLQTLIDARSTEDSKDIDDSLLAASVDTGIGSVEHSDIPEKKGSSNKNTGLQKCIQLDDREIIGNSVMFFLAGFETTSTALAFITHVLVNRADEQDKLRTEIKEKIGPEDVDYESVQRLSYMDRFIMECLRIYPPVYAFVSRMSSRKVKLGKWLIPENVSVQIPVHYLHHDPDLWPEPEKFDPDRFLPENRSADHSMIWLPFGAGPRNCIGMRLALLEIKLALARILKEYSFEPSEKTEKEQELEIHVSVASLRPQNGIHVRARSIHAS